ncbi:chitin deacetylase [Actinomortierella ambigua]|nr:chitin deacetylase [Actinomortierella ambigua]
MKVSTILSLSALFMASLTSAVMPHIDGKIDHCVTPGTVAMTFDDGPGVYTDQLLTILDKHQIKVTFFIIGSNIGKSPAYPALLKKVHDKGHQLASHTFSHSNLDNMDNASRVSEINRTSDLIFQAAGVHPRYMRAPEGACDKAKGCPQAMDSLNQTVSHWNVDTKDWQNVNAADPVKASMQQVDEFILTGNPATDSFIMLQHDIHQFSVEKLTETIITAVKAKGFRFVTMEECVGIPAYKEGPMKPNPSATSSGAANKPTQPGVPKSDATMKQLGAWTLGVAALASTLLF